MSTSTLTPLQTTTASQDAIGARYRATVRRLEGIQEKQRVLMDELWSLSGQARQARAEVDRLAAEHRAVERELVP